MILDPDICSKARHTRDARFDGKFFTAVKTTKIYCRPICPATTPREENVTYYPTAIAAATAGYRPCLRCRPDSAPESPAWKGVNTTLDRAIRLINDGALQNNSVASLAIRLGVSDRYLRELFKRHVGISPKSYALYQQCLFAKQLLHQTTLPITQVALASGFNSIRRFNDCFQTKLKLTPSAIRKTKSSQLGTLQVKLYYRPPYNWPVMQAFLAARVIDNLEWCDATRYGRTFEWSGSTGLFTAEHIAAENCFNVEIELDDVVHIKPIIGNIRRILDTDVDIQTVEKDLLPFFSNAAPMKTGLRLPGTWNLFEAGIRAILGQQVSVSAAKNLVAQLVNELGSTVGKKRLFPTPQAIAANKLDFFRMPAARKQTLKAFSEHYIHSNIHNNNPNDVQGWLQLKGIGPWTVDYATMRGLSDPDIYLGGDLGIKKAIKQLNPENSPDLASPWRSYLTIQLWNLN